jgi:hypothetical protein
MSQIWKWSAGNDSICMAPFLWQWHRCSWYFLITARLVWMEYLFPQVQLVFFDIGGQGRLSSVFTSVIADLPIGIIIILLHQDYSQGFSYLHHYTRRLGWMFKHLIGNEDWLSSAMHVQVLSQGVLLGSSVNTDFSPGWP